MTPKQVAPNPIMDDGVKWTVSAIDDGDRIGVREQWTAIGNWVVDY